MNDDIGSDDWSGALSSDLRRTLKLNVEAAHLPAGTTARLPTIVAAIAERQRENQRAGRGKYFSILLGESDQDLVDTRPWDDFLLTSPLAIAECSRMAGEPPKAVLAFVMANCSPSNWTAFFWMGAWFETVLSTQAMTEKVLSDAAKAMQEGFAAAQAEQARQRIAPAAEARKQKGVDQRSKIVALAEPLRGKKSKEQAAAIIASQLNMSTATIRKKLISMYPKGDWKSPQK